MGDNLKKSLFIRNNLKKTKFENVKKNIKLDKELLNSFDPFINSFRCNKLVKSIILIYIILVITNIVKLLRFKRKS
jgi:hypothetical protein